MKLMIMGKTTSDLARANEVPFESLRRRARCALGANVFRYPNFPPSLGNSCPDVTPRLVPLLGIGRAAGRGRLSPTAGAVHGQTLSDRRVSSGRPGRVAGPTDVVSGIRRAPRHPPLPVQLLGPRPAPWRALRLRSARLDHDASCRASPPPPASRYREEGSASADDTARRTSGG